MQDAPTLPSPKSDAVELALATAEQQGAPTLAQPKDATPPKLTRKQIGSMRRQFLTVVHGEVRLCGHKIDLRNQPKNNCEACWQAWFKTVDGLLVRLHETLVTKGLAALRAEHGDRLVKMFARFLDMELHNEPETQPEQKPGEPGVQGSQESLPESQG